MLTNTALLRARIYPCHIGRFCHTASAAEVRFLTRLLDQAGRARASKDLFPHGSPLRTHLCDVPANCDDLSMKAIHLGESSLARLLEAIVHTIELGADGADFRDNLFNEDLANCGDEFFVGHRSNSTLAYAI